MRAERLDQAAGGDGLFCPAAGMLGAGVLLLLLLLLLSGGDVARARVDGRRRRRVVEPDGAVGAAGQDVGAW